MRVREAVVVEGRCDKAKLSALIEGTIVETGGFAIFNDRDKMELILDTYGKERRKAKPSKEGKLGVEGMTLETLRDCLIRAGAIIEGAPGGDAPQELTKADLFELGLSGGESSADRRKALQRRLKLPERLSANGLLQALRALYTREELLDILENLEGEDTP